MINLLPENEKRNLIFQAKWSKIILFVAILITVSLIFTGLIFGVHIYLSLAQKNTQQLLKEKEEIVSSKEFKDFKNQIQQANKNLQAIQKFFKTNLYLIEVIENISSLLPQKVYFKEIKIERKIGKNKLSYFQIYIEGQAATRKDLYEFKKRLENQKNFLKVYFSPSSWIKKENSEFSLTLQYKK